MKRLSVSEAAKEIGVAASTVYGMVSRGELTALRNGASITLDPKEVEKIPKRSRGRQERPSHELIGAMYIQDINAGLTTSQIADNYGVTPSEIRQAIAHYQGAVLRESKPKPKRRK